MAHLVFQDQSAYLSDTTWLQGRAHSDILSTMADLTPPQHLGRFCNHKKVHFFMEELSQVTLIWLCGDLAM